MTFEQWISKKEWYYDLSLHDSNIETRLPGFVYPDGSWIGLISAGWWTLVSNDERSGQDLKAIETFLWDMHSSHNYDNGDTIDSLSREYQTFCKANHLPDLSMDEQDLDLMSNIENVQKEAMSYAKLLKESNEHLEALKGNRIVVQAFLGRWNNLENK